MSDSFVFELTLKGFQGETDETDDHVLWIESDCPEKIRSSLSPEAARNVQSIIKLPLPASNGGIDFFMSGVNPASYPQLSKAIIDRVTIA